MLKSLTLTHFKSFREAEVPLGPFTLLVGTNASGKSNVRDALRFLHGCAQGYTLAEVLDEKWGTGGVLLWRGVRGGAREVAWRNSEDITLVAELAQSIGVYAIGVTLENGRVPRAKREVLLGLQHQVVFSSLTDENFRFFPQDDSRLLTVRSRRASGHFEDHRYLANTAVLPQIADDPDVADKELIQEVVSALRSMRFLDLHPDAMREPAAPGHLILGDRGENLSAVLYNIVKDPEKKDALLGWLRSLTPMDVTDLEFKEDLLGRVLVYLVEANGQLTSAASASDGTLRFLALVAALLSPESGKLYFFEEIDNGFHPTRLHLLLDVLEQASRRMGCQIIATTHNPQLLAHLSDTARQDAVLLYRLEGSQESKAIRIMDIPDVRRVLESQDLGRLFATGWLEDTLEFLAEDKGSSEPAPTEEPVARNG
jgi:predicted ATPase